MRLTKLDKRYLRIALYFAVQWEESLIDAHRVKLVRRPNGQIESVIPKEYRSVETRCRRNIAHFRRLSAALDEPQKGQ